MKKVVISVVATIVVLFFLAQTGLLAPFGIKQLSIFRKNEATADEVLGSIEGIESAEIHPGKQEGVLDIILSVLRDVDPRDDIFFAMADRRCPIIAMQYEESKLEDIFLRLTEADAAAPASEAEESVQSVDADEGEAEYTSQFSTAAYRVEEDEEGKGE